MHKRSYSRERVWEKGKFSGPSERLLRKPPSGLLPLCLQSVPNAQVERSHSYSEERLLIFILENFQSPFSCVLNRVVVLFVITTPSSAALPFCETLFLLDAFPWPSSTDYREARSRGCNWRISSTSVSLLLLKRDELWNVARAPPSDVVRWGAVTQVPLRGMQDTIDRELQQ